MKGQYPAAVFFAIVALLCGSIFVYPKTGTPTATSLNPKTVKRKSPQVSALNFSGEYSIRKGDTLYEIARKYKTTAQNLKSANNLRSNKLKIGQKILIPLADEAATQSEATETAAVAATVNQSAKPDSPQPEDTNQISENGSQPRRLQLVQAGFNFLGVRYKYSGTSEKSGFDCSGLVKTLFLKFDIDLPRSSREQFRQGEKVDRNELQAGDLVFFSSGGKQVTHVGIYIGDNKFLHAARKARQVIISDLNKIWYNMRYLGARRITDLWGDESNPEPQTSQAPPAKPGV